MSGRYEIRKGALHCYHLSDVSGQPVSVVSVIEHNISAEEMAFHLRQAAAWFQQIANGQVLSAEVKPKQSRFDQASRESLPATRLRR